LVEAYGDDPLQVLRNGMLGVARKRKYGKIKDKEAKRVKVSQLVAQWQAAMGTQTSSTVDWLLSKLD